MDYKPETATLICIWQAELKRPVIYEGHKYWTHYTMPMFLHGAIKFDMETDSGRFKAAAYVMEQLAELHRIVKGKDMSCREQLPSHQNHTEN